MRTLQQATTWFKQVDEFATQVVLLSTWSRLTKTFFPGRIVYNQDKHIQAFASEVITALSMLGLLVEVVLQPSGVLLEHVACVYHLLSIVGAMKSGEYACYRLGDVRLLHQLHHTAYSAFYPECLQPNIHYVKHCVDCVDTFKCIWHCFGPERKRMDANNAARYAFTRLVYTFFGDILQAETFQPYSMVVLWEDS
jgi:hypothetical protein